MKILELTNFSAGACGVWMRAKQEAELFAKNGHNVKVFSSNMVKGTDEIAPRTEMIGKLEVTRFPAKKIGGESFMKWDFMSEALRFAPDVIIAHSYRHHHTSIALRIKRMTGCKVFLVTHAPFLSDMQRSFIQKSAVRIYDRFIGPARLRDFDGVVTITRWENNILKNLGVPKEKIIYIPNGIPPEFFAQKKSKEKKKVLFLGRIAPVKDLEALIMAAKLLPAVKFELVGPAEKEYLSKLKSLNPPKNVSFRQPVYGLKEKIKIIDSARVFVLPSKRESMPQSLIEAMAREKIVIASDNLGAKELIHDGENGFIFPIGDYKRLADLISLAMKKSHSVVRRSARRSVEKFSWDIIIKKWDSLLNGPHSQ